MAMPGCRDAALVLLLEYPSVKTAIYFAYPQQKIVPARVKSFIAFAAARAADFVL